MLRASDRDRLLVQVVGMVWESVLARPLLTRGEGEDLDDDPRHFPALVGTIGISGAWEGDAGAELPVLLCGGVRGHDVRETRGRVLNELTFACRGTRIRLRVLRRDA